MNEMFTETLSIIWQQNVNAWKFALSVLILLFALFIALAFLMGILKVLQLGLNALFGE